MRPLALPIAGLAIATLAACGSAGLPPKAGYTAIVRARARAVAPLLTIRAADLPEVKPSARPPAPLARERAVSALTCGPSSKRHRPPSGLWAFARSDSLAAGSGYHISGASSTAFVMSSPAAARGSMSRGVRAEEACLRRALLKDPPFGLHIHDVVVRPLPATVPGADASVAYEAAAGVRGAPLLVYFDSFRFAYGQDAIQLTTYHSVAHVPRSVNERLLGLLVARARMHDR
jgi:hypothetical protein